MNCRRAPAFWSTKPGGATRAATSCSVRNPGSTAARFSKLRINSVATTTSTTAKASSTAASPRVRRLSPPSIDAAPAPRATSAALARVARSAGSKPNTTPRRERRAEREREHPQVDTDLRYARQVGGQQRDNELQRRERSQGTERARDDRERDVLDEQLAHEPAASGAQGGARRELALARRAAREQ